MPRTEGIKPQSIAFFTDVEPEGPVELLSFGQVGHNHVEGVH